jgi:hypothetical protein
MTLQLITVTHPSIGADPHPLGPVVQTGVRYRYGTVSLSSGGTLTIIAAIEHSTVYCQDPHSSRLARPGTAPIPGTGMRSIPNGLIPTDTRFNPVQLPEPTLSP